MTKSIIKTVFRKEWIYGLIYGFLSFFLTAFFHFQYAIEIDYIKIMAEKNL